MNKSESIVELSKALLLFQNDLKQPQKSGKNNHFNSSFVPLETIVEAINLYGKEHGLTFTQWPVSKSGVGLEGQSVESMVIGTMIMHAPSGEWIEYEPVYIQMDKNLSHAAGGIITYLRRYALSAVFGITSDDEVAEEARESSSGSFGSDTNIVSDNQLNIIGNKIAALSKKRGMGEKQFYQESLKAVGIDINKASNNLSSREASKLITHFSTGMY